MDTFKQGLLTITWESYGDTLLEMEAFFVLPRSGNPIELSVFFFLKEEPEDAEETRTRLGHRDPGLGLGENTGAAGYGGGP